MKLCVLGSGTRDLGVTPNHETAGAGAASILTPAPMMICMAMCLVSGKRLLNKVLEAYVPVFYQMHVMDFLLSEFYCVHLCAPLCYERLKDLLCCTAGYSTSYVDPYAALRSNTITSSDPAESKSTLLPAQHIRVFN